MMIAVLVAAPGLISALIYYRLADKKIKTFEFLVCAVVFMFFIMMFSVGVAYLYGLGELPLNGMFDKLRTTVRYGALALLASVCLPFVYHVAAKLLRREK